MNRLGASIALVVSAGVLAAGCGSSGGNSEPKKQATAQSKAEQQNAAFLALLDKHGVLSVKSDAELVEIGRSACETADLLPEHAEGLAGQLRFKTSFLMAVRAA
ncbi:DUF732 domain-containing protein [Streptomyces vietnamensis]|uniref:DUF732 domain-containing protein n=1 Tax=Streptomyces vietnamensis TaxID=362257 RepID=A0A0B5I201_9ACTN|nr:DUF732 domain-containing protein [Streptomyces vietnamensis]AJF68175.1 hypothetical protein SVTN_31240 [Streptomyces vietnamensis]